jgi:hypothetical protein
LVGRRVDEVRDRFEREPTGQCEFHAALVRSEVFSKYGKLDEHTMSVLDHTDLCLLVRSGGDQVFFEPNSIVTYVPHRLRPRELPFYMLRWSDEWTKHSQDHFLGKWRAREGKPHYTHVDFVRQLRGNGMPNMRRRAIGWCGWRVGSRIIDLTEVTLAKLGNTRFAGLDSSPHYRVVHAVGSHSEPPS